MSIYGNKDFMGQPAPPGYVAGLGRGASGFTTRSDIGPARDDIETNVVDEQEKDNEANDDSERYQDPDNEVGLFAGIQYDQDDDEADKIYEAIDEKMDERRKVRREEREKAELERYRKERPKIQQQFADLKRGLAVVSEDEWANLPDVGDLVGKNRKKNKIKEKFTPVPDSLLDKARMESSYDNAISLNGTETPAGSVGSGLLTNFVEIGQANNKVFNLKLGQVSDSKGGQSTIDPKGYLTELSSVVLKTDAEIGDIKKARSLLSSVTGSNPKYAPGWIASARLEEVAGKIVKARQIMKEGCERCPDSEDVWLEAARLNTNENAKIILAESIRHIQDSVKIWLAAAKLETEVPAKKRVLRKALENIPTSVTIWKAAIDLEESHDEARILLASAVELVPSSVDLWLALAKLEPHDKARKVINKARKAIPTSHEIWIAAAHLEEQNGNSDLVQKLIYGAITELSKYGVVLNRDQWIKLAEESELEYECIETCQAIIRATLAMNVDPVDQLDTWLEDAENSTKNKAYETARAMYAFCLNNYPDDSAIWERAAFFEKDHGTSASLEELLDRAVKHCPHEEILWLMWAKEEWIAGNVEGAGSILARAFEVNPNSEQIWLAAVKLEVENLDPKRAQALLAKARTEADTEKVWMKSIVLERQLEDTNKALELLEQANEKFPKFDKLWMIKGQIYQQEGKIQEAREAFNKGIKLCPKSITLWILTAELEESANLHIKARSVLERARLINPKTPELWLAAIRLEIKFNNPVIAKSLLSKAIQECPDSNILWAEAIILEPRAQRKSKLADALKNCNADPLIISVMARNLWAERKIDKARNMFVRSLKQNPDHGDTWAWYLKFEKEQGTEEQVNQVIQQCIQAEPKHGNLWQKTAKKVRKFPLKGKELLEAVESQLDTII